MAHTDDLTLTQVIVTRYILVICGILSIIGSFCNIIIFARKKFRTNSCSVYFITTSIFNLLVIIFGITAVLLTSYLPNESALNSAIFCKIRAYIIHSFLMMSRSSVALACIDRFALSSRTVRIRRLNKFRIAVTLVVFISILWLIVPIHVLVLTDTQMPGYLCGAVGTYLTVYSAYKIIVTAIPLVIMVIFSWGAIQNVGYTRARVRPVVINTTMRMRRRDMHLMTILIGEVVVYFLSTVWFPLYTIYIAITVNTFKTADRLAIEGLIRYLVLSFLIYFSSCSIFYIHLLTSKVFRQECKQWILHLFKRNENDRDRVPQRTSLASNIRNQLNNVYDRQQIDANPGNNQ